MLANAQSSSRRLAYFPPCVVKTLVLDDSEFDRMKVRRLMRATNFMHELSEAASLSELKERIDKQSFDIVIMDFELPDGSGLNALEMLRCNLNSEVIGSILISSHSISISSEAYEKGCSAVLPKQGLCSGTFTPAFLKALGCTKV